MDDFVQLMITWTTYGTWLPGDERGWRHRKQGSKEPQPPLEKWAREQMTGAAVLLKPQDRSTVEQACEEHCTHRAWRLLAVNARSNHIHAVVSANAKPSLVRDQLKANCTRRLRIQQPPLHVPKTWTRGGDCSILTDEAAVQAAIEYVLEQQDKPRTDDPKCG